MKRVIVLAMAGLVLAFGTGINGCSTPFVDVEVVVPPDATGIEDSLVVILDSKGDRLVIPWEQFVEMDLTDYHTVGEMRDTLHIP